MKKLSSQTFMERLVKSGSKVLIHLPFDPDEVWGQKPRHYVHGVVRSGKTEARLRALIQEGAEGYVISVGAAFRRDNGVDVGDEVTVTIEPEGPQLTNMAADIVAAITTEPEAVDFFNGLATHYRKNYVNWVEEAKRSETRANRIVELVGLLKEGRQKK